MLPKPHRLPSSEIKSVMRRGKRVSSERVQLIYRKWDSELDGTKIRLDSRLRGNDKKNESRFAFVVPISVDKRAVVRNRLRRLVRESVRLALPTVAAGWDGVFFVKKRLPDEFIAVDTMVRELLRRAALL